MNRLFVVEPGLSNLGGHPIQYAVALEDFGRRSRVPVLVVCRQRVDHEVLKLLSSPIAILPDHCFPISQEAAERFCHVLGVLDARYVFGESDLLLISSAHINELRGLGAFLTEKGSWQQPNIALIFHQLVPPASDHDMESSDDYRSYWLRELQDAFVLALRENRKLSLWTTESSGLNKHLSDLSDCWVGKLPFLFVQPKEKAKKKRRSVPTFAFLGDGRAEKGLRLLLATILRCFPSTSNVTFFVQNIRTRGYRSEELGEVLSLLTQIRYRSNVTLIEEPLSPDRFASLLYELDVIVLPYDPRHYHDRSSMLYAQAAAAGIPAIVSEGTWMAGEIRDRRGCGTVFNYVHDDVQGNVDRLTEAIWSTAGQLEHFSECADQVAVRVGEWHSIDHFVSLLFARHGL